MYGTVHKVVIPFDATKKIDMFKGYALVTFDDPESVTKVLSMPEHRILNRKVIFPPANKT